MNNNDSHIEIESMQQSLMLMAIEIWRLTRVLNKLAVHLDVDVQKQYVAKFNWFNKKIEEALQHVDLKIVDVEGMPFDPGIPVRTLNIEEFSTEDHLIVDQMLEPILMGKDGVLKSGTVLLRKVEK